VQLAMLLKRARNITKNVSNSKAGIYSDLRPALKEPAEIALFDEMERRRPRIERALAQEEFLDAMNQVAQLHAPVDKFFVDVLVMAEDPALRQARLALVASLRDTILNIADIAEIAPDTGS
jgi:glycyl-tRNA synthetase beta chain